MEFWLSGEAELFAVLELVKMKSLIESKHQKIPFYDCNLTTEADISLLTSSECYTYYWKWVKSWNWSEQKKALAAKQQQQRKYSNPILISDNSHSLNLFEWKESSVRWRRAESATEHHPGGCCSMGERGREEKHCVESGWDGEQMNRIKFNSSTLFSISFSSHRTPLLLLFFPRQSTHCSSCYSFFFVIVRFHPQSELAPCLMKIYAIEIFILVLCMLEKSSRVSIISYMWCKT